MKIFVVSNDSTPDRSPYLQAILNAFGLCFTQRSGLDGALARIDPSRDVLLVSGDVDPGKLQAYLAAGGEVVAAPACAALARLAGATPVGTRGTPGRLRFVTQICPGARGEALWTVGNQTLYAADNSAADLSVLAYLFCPGKFGSESLGIWQSLVGSGRITGFGYDPTGCIAQLRQGLPERANHRPPGDSVPRAAHMHPPNPPHDTIWRPTADLHLYALCQTIHDLLARKGPVPALWHIPDGKSALLVFTGDEDGAAQEANRREMRDVESHGGRMTLFVIPNRTSITRSDIEAYTGAGHTVSVHPDLTPACEQSPSEQLAKAEADVRQFRETYGLPVRTVRNHCLMWPGYDDLPLLWERLGIGMDSSLGGSLYFHSNDGGPYPNVGAALPLPFVRLDGRLIDVYEQPLHSSDDMTSHPTIDYSLKYGAAQFESIFQRMCEDATRFYHAPLCVVVHPCNYATYAPQQGGAIMRTAPAYDMPIWPMDRWHDFWRARAAWRMSDYAWNQNRLSFTMSGPECEGLCVDIPAEVAGRSLRTLSIDGGAAAFESATRHGKPAARAPLPCFAGEPRVVAEYC